MNSIENYTSDDELQSSNSHYSQSSGKFKAVEQDVNYDNITMEMSEESSHNDPSSPRSDSSDTRSSTSSCRDYYDKKSKRKDFYSRSDERSHSDSPDYHKGGTRDAERKRNFSRKHWKDDRDHRDRDDRRSHRHSRSPSYHRYDRSRKSRSRSPRDRGRHSRRDHHSPSRRRRDNHDRSRNERGGGGPGSGIGAACDRKPSKLSILEKLGIELKLPETDKDGSPLTLPSYYNPVAMNPAKYAEQIAKRKLLWGNSNKQKQGETIEPTDSKSTSVWQGARFSQDQDGKLSAKFQRLMGIKKDSNGGDSSTSSQGRPEKDLLKKQEELFSSMELQYEVARQATHTQRGVGLGFGAHHFTK